MTGLESDQDLVYSSAPLSTALHCTFEVFRGAPKIVHAMGSLATQLELQSKMSSLVQAFDKGPWPRMHGRERGQILYKLADLMEVYSTHSLHQMTTASTNRVLSQESPGTARSAETEVLWVGLQ